MLLFVAFDGTLTSLASMDQQGTWNCRHNVIIIIIIIIFMVMVIIIVVIIELLGYFLKT